MDKKGQITLFIILGMVILVVAGLLFYFKDILFGKELVATQEELLVETPLEMQPIRLFVDECITEVANPAVYTLALQGGYLYPIPEYSLITENTIIAYYYDEGEITAPTLDEIKQQLELYIIDALPVCVDNFSSFEGKTIEQGEITVETKILKDKLLFRIKYPLTLIEDISKIKTEDFIISVPVRLEYVYGISQEIINKIKEDPDHIDMAYLADFDAEVTVLPYDESNIVYSIIDEESSIEDVPLVFMFAAKIFPNSPPTLEFIPDFVLNQGEQFSYDVDAADADGDKITYYSDSALINVDSETGIFTFTPPDVGDYLIEICAKDSYEKEDCREMKFFIQ